MKRKEIPFISFPASKVPEEEDDGPEIEIVSREGDIINESESDVDTYDTNSSQREFFLHEECFDHLNSDDMSYSSTSEESYTSGLSEYESDITLIRRTRDTFGRNDILLLGLNSLRRYNNTNYGMSNEEVNRLHSSKYSDIITNISECSICKGCFLDLNVVTELRCSHIFHSNCVIPWIIGNNNCPMCRQQVIER